MHWLFQKIFFSFLILTLFTFRAHADVDAPTAHSLSECVSLAIKQSPRIKAADEAVLKSDAEKGMARSAFFPSLTAYGTGKKIEGISSTGASNSDYDDQIQTTYGIQLTQSLFSGLTIFNGYQRSVLVKEYTIADRKDAISKLTLDVQTAYLDRLRAIEELKMLKVQQNSLETNAKATAAMFKQNLVSYSEVLKSDLEVSKIKQQISETDTYISGKTIELKGLMHVPFDNFFEFEPISFESILLPNIDILEARKEAISTNPSVILAKIAIDVTKKDRDIAYGELSPRVSLQLSYNKLDIDYRNLGGSASTYYYDRDYTNGYAVGLINLEWNLFSGGHTYYKVQRYQHELSRLENNLQDQLNSLYTSLERSFNAYTAAQDKALIALDSFRSAQEQYAMALSRLAKSIGTLPEVMLAKSQLQNSKSNFARARIDSLQALASMYQVMGKNKPALVE